MPCMKPLFTRVRNRPDDSGKKDLFFDARDARIFFEDDRHPVRGDYRLSTDEYTKLSNLYTGQELWSPSPMALPCRKCLGCGFNRSREWAARCYHESRLYDYNTVVTLTYDPKILYSRIPSGSLLVSEHQEFLNALRYRFPDEKFRYFVAGEYGSKEYTFHPHYHVLLFNFNCHDKRFDFYNQDSKQNYYRSALMEKAWPYGRVVVGEFSWKSAAYVARYCMKKMLCPSDKYYYTRVDRETGEIYDLLPEYSQPSLKPGLGKGWFDKFGMTDVFPNDSLEIDGVPFSTPKYYDNQLKKIDEEMLRLIKLKREEFRNAHLKDTIYSRLKVIEMIKMEHYRKLVRPLQSKEYRDL